MTPLANVIIAGLTSGQRSIAEPRAEPAEGADHGVDDEQDPVLGAEVGDALDVALGRQVDAAGADHRLAEERGDLVRADARGSPPPARAASRTATVEVCGTSGPQLVDVGLDPAERRAEAVRAVVALRARDQVHALGLAGVDEVAAGELGRDLDRVAAAAGQEDLGARASARARPARSQISLAGRFPTSRERVVGLDALHLRGDRVGDLGAAVAEVGVPQRGGGVEIARRPPRRRPTGPRRGR